ncbi:hypothetical protein GRAN_2458 [Granulicella sibirica]|uniref:Uncharacterized protein n=1 Tax=Granulicella sibirica TaxID=2479048 RepID=A0A4Q0T220_9BACT|nr:hypothetical protein GRAN_2458 [Granulicella sibirica]
MVSTGNARQFRISKWQRVKAGIVCLLFLHVSGGTRCT